MSPDRKSDVTAAGVSEPPEDPRALASFTHNGLYVYLYPDEHCSDPRREAGDNLGHMYCWHPEYELGDEQFHRGEYESLEAVEKHLRDERGAALVLPLHILDHSGITMRIGAGAFPSDPGGWDSSDVGFIYVERQKLLAEYGELNEDALAKARAVLEAEVEEYARYLAGEVYSVVINDPLDGATLESCGGCLGSDYAEETGRELAEGFDPEQLVIDRRRRATERGRSLVAEARSLANAAGVDASELGL